ncbi:MAG: Flp family type IVb pilin [Hyphomicrobiales bacterium]|nr:MAG: Flp family type IVb pilin [Hyphomicrobiales bacterium]
MVRRWAGDERGAVAVEYGVILAVVFLTMVGSLYTFGDQLKAMLDFLSATVAAALA